MGSLVFNVDQKFKTKGIWASKGRKNLILNSKDAAIKVKECGEDIKLLFQHIDVEDGFSRLSFNVGYENLANGGVLKIDFDEKDEAFTIEAKGTFKIDISEAFVELFVKDGEKLKFILMGVIAKEGPHAGGYISRYEEFDRDLDNYQDCPSVNTNLIP